MKIYFAAPLFCKAERDFNIKLTNKIEDLGFEVFLPQRDGAEKERAPYDTMSKDERRLVMFSMDRDKILECDIFLFILDGRVPDEGACFELGIAYTQRYLTKSSKLLIGLQTDIRAAFLGSRLNPMLRVPLDEILESQDDLLKYFVNMKSNKKH